MRWPSARPLDSSFRLTQAHLGAKRRELTLLTPRSRRSTPSVPYQPKTGVKGARVGGIQAACRLDCLIGILPPCESQPTQDSHGVHIGLDVELTMVEVFEAHGKGPLDQEERHRCDVRSNSVNLKKIALHLMGGSALPNQRGTATTLLGDETGYFFHSPRGVLHPAGGMRNALQYGSDLINGHPSKDAGIEVTKGVPEIKRDRPDAFRGRPTVETCCQEEGEGIPESKLARFACRSGEELLHSHCLADSKDPVSKVHGLSLPEGPVPYRQEQVR